MAQTRLEKIGTIYSRMTSLLKTGAVPKEMKPLWYEVYEAFPPKYEPRYDRHLLPYGIGGNVAAMPPPPKILYAEDVIRAKYYNVFMPADSRNKESTLASKEEFHLVSSSSSDDEKTLSQLFVAKYQHLQQTQQNIDVEDKDKLFSATVDALELDGIHLTKRAHRQEAEETYKSPAGDEESRSIRHKKKSITAPSVSELFASSTKKDD